MLRELQGFQVQLKTSSKISDGAFPERLLILPLIFPCLYWLISVPCNKRKVRKKWVLPSIHPPMTNLHRIIQWCGWWILAEWGLSEVGLLKRWGVWPKRSASSEGQGSSWPCLLTASSSWREISYQDSGVLGEEDLEHLLKDEEGWGFWGPGVVGCVLQQG